MSMKSDTDNKRPAWLPSQIGNGDHIVIKDHAYRLSLQILL
jgi:hypothetical protein